MLQFIRSKVTSIFIKALFAVLIVSFAIWGIGDIFLGSPSGHAAITVGDVSYNSVEVLDRFDRTRRSMRLPPQAEQSMQPEILGDVIDSMVENGLYAAAGNELGLHISDQQLKDWIAESPNFRNVAGQFDPERFRQALFNARLSEAGFFQVLRQDLKRQQLASAVSGEVDPPDALVDAIFAYRGERRTVKLLTVRFDAVDAPAAIEDSALRAHYDANKDAYMAPEYRRVAMIALTPDELAREILVPEEDLRTAYETRLDEFTTPATRDLVQFLFEDEAAAQAALEGLASPLDAAGLDGALTAAAGDDGRIELGAVTRAGLTTDGERDAAFAAAAGEASPPVETPFGWKVFLARSATEEVVRAFADVRDGLRDEIAREQALDALFELANAFEDALAGGATIEEAARAIDAPVRRIDAIDASGRDRTGAAVENLPAGGEFLSTVFAAAEGEQSDLVETEAGGYIMVRIDSVIAPALRPFDEVSEDVRADRIAELRYEAASERAQRLAEQSKGGAGLDAAAAAEGLATATVGPFDRTGDGLDRAVHPGDLPSVVFDLAAGEVGTTESDLGMHVAELIEVTPADPETLADLRASIVEELSRSIAADYVETFLAALRRDYAVTIDRGYIDTLMAESQ